MWAYFLKIQSVPINYLANKKVDYYAKLRTTIFKNILVAYLSLLIPFLSYQTTYVYKTTGNVNGLVLSL